MVRICSSLISLAKQFQLFHPIGGVGARRPSGPAAAAAPARPGTATQYPRITAGHTFIKFAVISGSG